jgi:hypothetical protein
MYKVIFMTDRNKDLLLSPHFKVSEFACNDHSPVIIINGILIAKLALLRSSCNFPIIITSGYRTVEYNKKVGGVSSSLHLTGDAVDLAIPEDQKQKDFLLHYCNLIFDNCIEKDTYIHCPTDRYELL